MDDFALRARSRGVRGDDLDDFLLALNEALANAVRHGSRENPDCFVWLRCGIDAGRKLWARVRDGGDGFDPSAVPDPRSPDGIHRPNGRRLLLIRSLCEEVEWRRGGTELYFVKYLALARDA
jgi:serine/threonine-protein kinase RsbW